MKKRKIALSAVAILAVVSCGTDYRMVTTLERNGKVHREVYDFENHRIGTGKKTMENPFLFNISDWKVTHFDDTVVSYNFFGEKREFRMKISKDANSIEQYSQEIQCDEENQSLAAPKESLTKKFRWFYTYYSFKTVYKKLKYEIPVSIDDYLTKEEQMLWTQGDMSKLSLMNGYETNDYLSGINDKFTEWSARNCFEIGFAPIKKLTTKYDLDADKEDIYKAVRKENDGLLDITPEAICEVLDSFYETAYFSQLSGSNKKIFDEADAQFSFLNYIGNTISYELVIPGKLLKTNAPLTHSDTLTWKVDGIRLLFEDYTLTAEYRVANIWAFILSILMIIIAIGSVIVVVRRK